ncbi:MAG: hypothetical protein JOZ16_18775 [Methylobacteriaceae bacterium]|nr:hypothetical protein [Methylobacteriaceae bacterium]
MRFAFIGAAALAAFAAAPTAFAQRGEGFSQLAGTWSGQGTISTTTGSERIRCRVNYSLPGANAVHQDLRCASDSYNFQVASDIVDQGGAISGTWTEVSRGVSGNVSGRISGGSIQGAVSGGAFTAGLSISTSGNKQSVSIRPSAGDIRDVSVSLTKGR